MNVGRATCGLLGLALVGWTSCTPPSNEVIDASFIHIPGESDADRAPHMAWNTTHMDLGLLAAGEQRRLTYTVTNDGPDNADGVTLQINALGTPAAATRKRT